MRSVRFISWKSLLGLLVVVIALLLTVFTVSANTRTGNGGDLPAYARIERGESFHNDEWAVIIFYRPPDCVPDDFNLLDFYDFEHAFECTPPTTDGFIVWSGEPGVSNPIQVRLHENGLVPVWFVNWGELQGAIADDILTVPELEALPSLQIGFADNYSETLHPTSEDVAIPMINYFATGSLLDGRSFYVHALLVTDRVTEVKIILE